MTRLWVMSFFEVRLRTCLKNHSYNLHIPLCGIFCPNSVAVILCELNAVITTIVRVKQMLIFTQLYSSGCLTPSGIV